MHLGQAQRRGRTRTHLLWLRSAGLVAALVLAWAGAAIAQGYPPAAETLAVSTTVAVPGQPVTVSGSGYEPGTTVTITFESTPQVVGVVTADAAGRFTAEIVVPTDATPGMHTIRATGLGADGTTRVMVAAIRVMDPAAGAAPGAGSRGGPFSAAPPAHAAAGGGSPPSAGQQATPSPAAPAAARRSGPLGLTGPVAIPLLVATGVGCVAVGTLLTRVRRRRRAV